MLLKQVPGSEFFPHFRAALKLRAVLRGEARPALCRQRGGGVKTFCRYQHNPAAAAICRSDLEADTEMIELLLITLTNVSVDLKSCKLYNPPPPLSVRQRSVRDLSVKVQSCRSASSIDCFRTDINR